MRKASSAVGILAAATAFTVSIRWFLRWELPLDLDGPGWHNSPIAFVGDLDGDGVRDVVRGDPTYREPGSLEEQGRVVAHSGSTGALLYDLVGEEGDLLGIDVEGVGDVTGDGIEDIACGGRIRVLVVSGSTGDVASVIDAPPLSTFFGTRIASGFDADADGVQDLCASRSGSNPTGRQVWLYSLGSGTFLHVWNADASSSFGSDVSAIGDVNGDGAADLAIGERLYAGPAGVESGRVHIVSGNPDQQFAILDVVDGEEAQDRLGNRIAAMGDIDGDGGADFAAAGSGVVYVVNGSRADVIFRIQGQLEDGEFGGEDGGIAAGDVDGDGIRDLLAGEPGQSPYKGKVYVYSGATRVLLSTLAGFQGGSRFGHALAWDGSLASAVRSRLLVAAPGPPEGGAGEGKLYLFERLLSQ